MVDVTRIADYAVIRELGAGGMGQVFLVQHPRLPRKDALKLLDAGVSRNNDFKARFQREADLLAQLAHPNIVTLYDRGEVEGRLWITMEYIDGTDASALLDAGERIDTDLVIELIAGAGAALDYAWRKQRITHRDVKPANILVGLDNGDAEPIIESVKLADFGIAKAAGESASLTSTGTTVGTMHYISPEAIEGDDVDNRSDIYSLGCTAFHLLTGRAPYAGKTIASLMSAHLAQDPPRISETSPDLPASLDPVFATVLAKNPDDRYQSCADFVAALQAHADGAAGHPTFAQTVSATTVRSSGNTGSTTSKLTGESAAPTTEPRRSRVGLALAAASAIVVVALGVIGMFALTRDDPDTPTTSAASSSTAPSTAPTPNPSRNRSARSVTTTSDAIEPEAAIAAETVVTSTSTSAAEPSPYEGMPCTVAQFNEVSADGTLYCSALTGNWRDKTHQSRPAVARRSSCSEPGARARIEGTDGLATCIAGPDGTYTWDW